MRLGPSLIGAIVGAVVGVAAQIGLESSMGKEANWFALVVGLLTGLGARSMAGDGIRVVSYVRAGLTALVALAAIVGGSYAASEMVRKQNIDAYESAPKPATSTPAVDERDDSEATEGETVSDEAADAEAAETEEAASDQESDADSAETEAAEADPTAAASEDAMDDAADTTEVDDQNEAFADTGAEQRLDLSAINRVNRQPAQLPPPSPWQFAFFGIGTFLAYELARGGTKHPAQPAAQPEDA